MLTVLAAPASADICALGICLGTGGGGTDPVGEQLTYTTVTHPDATRQSTSWGRALRAVRDHDGLVYSGYGDGNANTGPITLRPFDPATGRFGVAELSQDTEAISQLRSFGSRLWSPALDTRRGLDYAVRGNGWSEVNLGGSYHLYDIVGNGRELFASGSARGACSTSCGTVWRSTDGGATWAVSYQDATSASPPYGGFRCFALSWFGGQAWVNCSTGTYTFANGRWTATATGYAHYSSLSFGGNLITARDGNLVAWDGAGERVLRTDGLRYADTDGSRLWVVTGRHRVLVTSDLTTWTDHGAAPDGTLAFTAAGGRAFFGAADAQLHVSSRAY